MHPLKIVLITDVFPPRSGGSGWSAYYLGKALAARGHSVRVLRPRYDIAVGRPSLRKVEYGGLPVEELFVPQAPGWAAKAGFGRAWQERAATAHLARRAARLATHGEADVLHGQHKVSGMATSIAASRVRSKGARVASITTVRDYWPLCPASTRLFVDKAGKTFECEECHLLGVYLNCALVGGRRGSKHSEKGCRGRHGDLPCWIRESAPGQGRSPCLPLHPFSECLLRGVADLPLALARWLGTWQSSRLLAKCDATIGVSLYVRDQLAMSGRVSGRKLVSIPNLVDLPSVDSALAGPWPLNDILPEQPFVLFVGKLDVNKGARMLSELVHRAGLEIPLVLAGDGPLERALRHEAMSRKLDFRFYEWLDNEAVLKLMRHAKVLLFPSAWQEPLSRVLLEGCAAGAAIVALNTGGTRDIITHGVNGWLAQDLDSLVEGAKAVVHDNALNARLRAGARAKAEQVFAAPKVSAEVEALYYRLLEGLAERGASA